MAAALPLLGTQARIGPSGLPRMTTDWSEVFVAANRDRYETYFAIGRSMIVLLSAAAALVTAIWARERFGDAAGCLAALLWACEPTLLAHGSLVTTDMGAAAFFVFSLYAVWKFAQRPNWRRGALAFWMMLSVRYHPHHLAYFNELAGGPLGGRKHLLDSNLDWGQDLQGLKKYLDAQHFGEIGVAYFGGIRPELIGIAHHSVPAHIPEPGIYAISASFSEGRPLLIYRRNGALDFDFYAFSYFSFSEFKPIAQIGYSIDVFNLTQEDIAKWQAAFIEAIKRRGTEKR